jgi:hypothetical protein
MADEIAYVGDTSGDEILNVTFYQKNIDGEDVDFVNIKMPGDKTLEIDVQADDSHKARFRRKWEMYQNMQTMTGTLVDDWTDIPEGMRREFAYLGFKYVEQIAGAPDNAFVRVSGGMQWRVKAQAFLNRGKVSADDLISKQQEQINALMAKMAELTGEAPAKRGRKPKDEQPEG